MKVGRFIKPSTITDAYWIIADTGKPLNREKGGKWLIFRPLYEIDSAWSIIREATLGNILGPKSKVATARPNSNASDINTKVICVYTSDFKDKEDVLRVRCALVGLGFIEALNYKTNLDTLAGNYGKNACIYRSDGLELIERTDTELILPKGVLNG